MPALWLFTDARRLADPCQAVARLPKGLAGVVLRHDRAQGRLDLGRRLAALCRARRLVLVVAGDPALAARLRAGLHLRGGRHAGPARRRPGLLTSSAHGTVELRRARSAGAALVFLSPVFPTASHPGAAWLGPRRWTSLALHAGLPVLALGGVDGASAAALPRRICRGAGAISALAGGD